jgi:prepilin-type processing-associated H-X9-DG protein
MAITARLMKTDSANPKVRNERALEYDALSGFQDHAGALESLRQDLALREDILKTNPDYPNLRAAIANVRVRVGDELALLGSRAEGLQYNQSGLDLYEKLAAGGTDARSTRELAITLKGRGNILMADGHPAEALQCFHRAMAIVEPMAKAEPENVLLRSDVREIWYDTGRALVMAGKSAEGLAVFERVIQQWESEPNRDSKDIREALGFNLLWKGETLARIGKTPAALASYREGIASFEAASNKSAPHAVELAAGHTQTGAALAAMGKRQDAAAAYQEALAILEPLAAAQPTDFAALYAAADAYFGMGELSKKEAQHSAAAPDRQRNLWVEARDWYRKSAEAWRRIPNPGAISVNGFACGHPRDVTRMISICDTALRERSDP